MRNKLSFDLTQITFIGYVVVVNTTTDKYFYFVINCHMIIVPITCRTVLWWQTPQQTRIYFVSLRYFAGRIKDKKCAVFSIKL